MKEPQIDIFHREASPSTTQLEEICGLFKRNVPVFDEEGEQERLDTLAMRRTTDAYRELLETKTLIVVRGTRDQIAGLLEWDPRERGDVLIAYITWLLVDEEERGRGLSSQLHREFEGTCVPGLIETTQKTVIQGLSVHLKNPALKIYRRWGYSEHGAPKWNNGRLLCLIKDAVDS